MSKSKKPTGLSITRSGWKFIFKWKIGDKDYGQGQQLEYCINGGKWQKISIGKTTTSKVITLSQSNYKPTSGKPALTSITFRVRGNRKNYTTGSGKKKETHKPGWSDWAECKWTNAAPNAAPVTATLSDAVQNKTTFSWQSANNGANQMFTDCLYQTMLVKNCNTTDGSKLTWKNNQTGWAQGTSGASGSIAPVDSGILADDSWTRWVRVIARGPAGNSVWKYARHTYAKPNMATNAGASASDNGQGGMNCSVSWNAPASNSRPIGTVEIQYAIAIPTSSMGCPSGASWETALTLADSSKSDKATFVVDDTLDDDECLFVRVNTIYESKTAYGAAMLAKAGNLKDPSGLSVQTNDSTHKAVVTATNNSEVSGSFLAITYKPASDPDNAFVVGVITAGSTSATVQCPDWTGETGISFGVQAVVGSATAKDRADAAYTYELVKQMESKNTIWQGGTVPVEPKNVTAQPTSIEGSVRVAWDWSWQEADKAVISWADHEDAWESTDEPSTYEVTSIHAASWIVAGLETGKKWYFRVRLVKVNGDAETNGPWSNMVEVDLSSAPMIPSLTLSEGVITEEGIVTASWGYSSTDGTEQAYAELCEATISGGGITYGDVIAHTQTAQQVDISAAEQGWQAGTTHQLCVRVVSASGRVSDEWSAPVPVTIATPLECAITQHSLETVEVVDDESPRTTREVLSLTEMPLILTVTGAGAGGTTEVAVERAEEYWVERPDETYFSGFEDETITLVKIEGEGQVTIDRDSLIKPFDDEAKYRLIATVKDDVGQSASAELEFEVHWEHQALMPKAQIRVDQANYAAAIKLLPITDALSTDKCDIYRLSMDRPQLIVQDGNLGDTYIDPYPTIGKMGGHRIVFKTANGDYITEDNQLAWEDYVDGDYPMLDVNDCIIDFDKERVLFTLNTDVTNEWIKDFKETQYLDGSVEGDWSAGVSRKGSIRTVIMTEDVDMIRAFRRLAEHVGPCHVRILDGSSYTADVQVKQDIKASEAQKISTFDLTITRTDPDELDGQTEEEWYA